VCLLHGDCREVLKTLPDESVHCVVCSPPYYGLRDYGMAGQIGLEATPDAYVAELVAVFCEVRRVLRDDGTLWCNLGDSYAGHNATGFQLGNEVKNGGVSNKNGVGKLTGYKPKDLLGIPWMVAFALRADGWYLRQDIIWSKPNPMPESVRDRCTKAHEYLFLLSKSPRYFYDAEAIREPHTEATLERVQYGGRAAGRRQSQDALGKIASGNFGEWDRRRELNPAGRNPRSVWEVATQPFSEAHFAVFPPALIEPCIKAGCPRGGVVLDPFSGAGTTGLVADRLGRDAILIELNPAYGEMATRRIQDDAPLFAEVAST